MKCSTSRSASSSLPRWTALTVQLTWSHYGVLHRVTAWPELDFEQQLDGRWTPFTPDPGQDRFASGVAMLDRRAWDQFLDFFPSAERAFVNTFKTGRLAALAVLTQCPSLLAVLAELPALTVFLAHHVALRGEARPAWATLNAVHERDGVYGLMEWLGLPASAQSLGILAAVAEPDLSRRLLAPFRAALWEPETLWALQHTPTLTERALLARCHAFAA
jgi:hypothetical protein